jgi:hypothetical protein
MTVIIALIIICLFAIFALSALVRDEPGGGGRGGNRRGSHGGGHGSGEGGNDQPDPPELDETFQSIVGRPPRRASGVRREQPDQGRPDPFQHEGLWGDGT